MPSYELALKNIIGQTSFFPGSFLHRNSIVIDYNAPIRILVVVPVAFFPFRISPSQSDSLKEKYLSTKVFLLMILLTVWGMSSNNTEWEVGFGWKKSEHSLLQCLMALAWVIGPMDLSCISLSVIHPSDSKQEFTWIGQKAQNKIM